MSRFMVVGSAMAVVVITWASAGTPTLLSAIGPDIIIATSSGKKIATGRNLTPYEEAAIPDILADLDSCTGGGQNYTAVYNNFIANGGKIGVLTGGPVHRIGWKGVTAPDASAILIRTDDKLNPSKVRARIGHELIHAKFGGKLDDCEHASNWKLTFDVLKCLCYLGKKTDCEQFVNARNQYDKRAAACTTSGGNPGPPPDSTNPPCCAP